MLGIFCLDIDKLGKCRSNPCMALWQPYPWVVTLNICFKIIIINLGTHGVMRGFTVPQLIRPIWAFSGRIYVKANSRLYVHLSQSIIVATRWLYTWDAFMPKQATQFLPLGFTLESGSPKSWWSEVPKHPTIKHLRKESNSADKRLEMIGQLTRFMPCVVHVGLMILMI